MNEIARNFGRNFAHLFIVIGLLLVVMSFGIMDNNKQSVNRPHAEGSYTQTMETFKCENTPEGQFPTAVVLREVGGGYMVSVNPDHISKGLDEALAGKEWKRFDPIHFCK